MKKQLALCSAALLALLTACGNYPTAGAADLMQNENIRCTQRTEEELTPEFITAQTDFALRLSQQIAAKESGRNMMVSPYSVMQALAMTANGAGGTTQTEMEQLLSGACTADSAFTRNKLLRSFRDTLEQREHTKLHTANSIWFRDQKGFDVKLDFLQKNADFYDAGAFRAPFDESTVSDINAWVKKHTDGMIPKLIDSIGTDSVMYLINAVSFDAKWANPYTDVQIDKSGRFTAADGTVQNAVMLSSTEDVYLSDAHARGFLKHYEDGYTFAALLPEEGMTPEAYLAGLDAASLQSLFRDSEACEVHAVMPEFTCDYGTELSDALKAMGMQQAFTGDADFTGISESMPLYIGAVQHQTHIELNAAGTKAAAATSVEVKCAGVYVPDRRVEEITLDRPYVYMILDNDTMLPLFVGTVNSLQ